MITPNVSIWLNAIYLGLTGLTVGGLEAAGVSHGDSLHVVAIAAIACPIFNFILHAYSANVAGPAVK
jgi:hypothetical protein